MVAAPVSVAAFASGDAAAPRLLCRRCRSAPVVARQVDRCGGRPTIGYFRPNVGMIGRSTATAASAGCPVETPCCLPPHSRPCCWVRWCQWLRHRHGATFSLLPRLKPSLTSMCQSAALDLIGRRARFGLAGIRGGIDQRYERYFHTAALRSRVNAVARGAIFEDRDIAAFAQNDPDSIFASFGAVIFVAYGATGALPPGQSRSPLRVEGFSRRSAR